MARSTARKEFDKSCLPKRNLQIQGLRKDSMSALLRLLYATSVRHDFLFRCVHVPGVTNVVADALSRGCSLQELLRVLPSAEAEPTPAPPLQLDGEDMVPWKEEPLG